MSSNDRPEDNSKTDDPNECTLIFLTGKRKEERKLKEKAIRFPVKSKTHKTKIAMSSSDRSEDKSKTDDDPYDRMLTYLTGKRKEERKAKEKAIRFPIKLMYIIQCGDYNHLIDWIEAEEENPSEQDNNISSSGEAAIKKCETNTTALVSPPSKSTAFIIYDKIAFETHVLPAIFKEGKFDSFERKLYRWGFAKKTREEVTGKPIDSSNDSSVYEHPYFRKGDYTTASTISCSGSEVKRYRQMQKDQKNRLRKRRRKRSKVSSSNSSMISLDKSPAAANLDRDIATTGKNAAKKGPPTAADNHQSFLYREDRWDELYLSAFRCPPKKEDNMGSAYLKGNNRKGNNDDEGLESLDLKPTSSAMLASSRVQHQHDQNDARTQSIGRNATSAQHTREQAAYLKDNNRKGNNDEDKGLESLDLIPTSSAMLASSRVQHQHDQREQNDVQAQSIGMLTATSAQHTREQAMLLGKSNTAFSSLLQEMDDMLAEDVMLLQELRRRHNYRENILKMIQRSFQK